MRLALLSNASVIHTRRWGDYFHARGHEVLLISLEAGDGLRLPHRDPALGDPLALSPLPAGGESGAPSAHGVRAGSRQCALRPQLRPDRGDDRSAAARGERLGLGRARLRAGFTAPSRAGALRARARRPGDDRRRDAHPRRVRARGERPSGCSPCRWASIPSPIARRGAAAAARPGLAAVVVSTRKLEPIYDLDQLVEALPAIGAGHAEASRSSSSATVPSGAGSRRAARADLGRAGAVHRDDPAPRDRRPPRRGGGLRLHLAVRLDLGVAPRGDGRRCLPGGDRHRGQSRVDRRRGERFPGAGRLVGRARDARPRRRSPIRRSSRAPRRRTRAGSRRGPPGRRTWRWSRPASRAHRRGAAPGMKPREGRRERTLLAVAYFFPPLGGGGVQRTVKFLKYLRPLGWRSEVVTARARSYWVLDDTLAAEVPPDTVVHRTAGADRVSISWRRSAAGAKARPRARGDAVRSTAGFRAWRCARRLLPRPRRLCRLVPVCARRGARARGRGGIDVLLTTSSPDTAHLVGLVVREQLGMPWVADFRDPWVRRLTFTRADAAPCAAPDLARAPGAHPGRSRDRHQRGHPRRFSRPPSASSGR